MWIKAALLAAAFASSSFSALAADKIEGQTREVTPSQEATFVTIYVVPGVFDSGHGPLTGEATTFLCSNLSGATQQIRFRVLRPGGVGAVDKVYSFAKGQTLTVSTHNTLPFAEDAVLSTFGVLGGMAVIFATSGGVYCSAFLVDAAATSFSGLGVLHMVRFNPVPGSVE